MTETPPEPDELAILWTSSDREVALKMVFSYVHNAAGKKWWKNLTFIIWGPSTRLLSQDRELQEHIHKMKEGGVILQACRTCAEEYDVVPILIGLDIDVKLMGEPLTRLLKNPSCRVMTF
ncbi:MAG: hypothetical protein LUQ61_07555 [Methanoregulaceae archaeon]|nr:hypothetical protein [Methanoregulaceae archaeon]